MSTLSAASNNLLLSASIGAAIAAASGITYWYYKSYKPNYVIPEKWRRVGTLDRFYFFPIKACAPLKFDADDEVACELLGLQWNGLLDRSLIILDANNGIVTTRTYPKLVLIEAKIVGPKKLRFSAEGMEPIELNFAALVNTTTAANATVVNTSVWGSKLQVQLCGEKYDAWFSQAVLGKSHGMRLACYHHTKPVRAVHRDMKHEPFISYKDTGTLGDGTSYMLMNLASVDDLNTRLPTNPVDPLQFRGNFYVKMEKAEPYAEDHWNWIKIGNDAVFRVVAPCTRCIVPNVRTTGERDMDGEPLRTLKTYRKVENYKSPPLGVHMGLRRRGNVKLHDPIYVADV